MTTTATAVEVTQAGFNLFGIAGFTPTTFAVALVGVLTAALTIWPRLRKIDVDSDAGMRADLFKRIVQLEKDAIEERRVCAAQLSAMQAKVDAMQEQVTALVRQLVQYQVTTGQALPISVRSPAIEHALQTLAEIEKPHG